jgi:uncharacterized protein YjbK
MMSINIEIEAKTLVSKEDFFKIKTFLKLSDATMVIQTNHYIDNPTGGLRKFGFALRIRELNDTFTLTLKSPMAEGSLEKHQVLSLASYTKFKNNHVFPEGMIKDFLAMFEFDTSELSIITALTTRRIDTTFENRHVCLDQNVYNGKEDYEIESEESSIKCAAETLKKLCLQAGATYAENNISKYARALKSIAK